MHANYNIIGQLTIYSHGSTPNIVIEPKKERFLQKNSYKLFGITVLWYGIIKILIGQVIPPIFLKFKVQLIVNILRN